MFEIEGIAPIRFDILTDKFVYQIYFDPLYVPSMEDKILLLLKQYAYEEAYEKKLEGLGFINIATGYVSQFTVNDLMREQMSYMWQHLQLKYNLSQENVEE